jgi:hypothetical protein
MMPLRRTPLLPPGWGLSPPSRASIGASSAAGAAGGGAGMLLAGGRGSAALQIAFCSAGAFPAVLCRSAASPVEKDWWLSPLPIVHALPPVSTCVHSAGRLRVGCVGELEARCLRHLLLDHVVLPLLPNCGRI